MSAVSGRAVGAPLSRVEGGEKVRGEARYAYEFDVENVAYGALVVSAVAKGTIRSVDASEALAVPG
ncbi:MAG: hypothetical protein ACRDLK_10290, partial [Gaiellaceae bacterium]